MIIYTEYYTDGDHIYGPKANGLFFISGHHIYGPRNSGLYYLRENGHIYGPGQTGEFYILDGYIYGPSTELPWMAEETCPKSDSRCPKMR